MRTEYLLGVKGFGKNAWKMYSREFGDVPGSVRERVGECPGI